jgi:hypothetical protein
VLADLLDLAGASDEARGRDRQVAERSRRSRPGAFHGAAQCMRQTANRFVARFGHIETALAERGQTFQQSSPAEMDSLWREAKKRERKKPDGPAKT